MGLLAGHAYTIIELKEFDLKRMGLERFVPNESCSPNLQPCQPPQPSTLNPQPSTLNPQPSTLNPQPSTLNPLPRTPKYNSKIPNPKLSIRYRDEWTLRLIKLRNPWGKGDFAGQWGPKSETWRKYEPVANDCQVGVIFSRIRCTKSIYRPRRGASPGLSQTLARWV